MNALKPCLFNGVVYCQQKERVGYCLDLMHTMAGYFPCRLFVIHCLEEGVVDHYTQSREIPEGVSVASDWGSHFYDLLLVEVSRDQLHRVPFALFPFLVPELPIMLFWDCDPTEENAVLAAVSPYARRLIFDSETIGSLAPFAQRMLGVTEGSKEGKKSTGRKPLAQIDLNWVRLMGWRELLSKVFDTQERLEQLRAASHVHILYNAKENRFFHHSQTQALYLQAWLAAQMQWEYEASEGENGRIKRTYRSEAHVANSVTSPVLSVTAEPLYTEQRAPGSLLCVEVISRLGTEVMMDSRDLSGSVRVKSVCDASCTLPYLLPLRGSKMNYRYFQQLLYQEINGHYDGMLKMLVKQE